MMAFRRKQVSSITTTVVVVVVVVLLDWLLSSSSSSYTCDAAAASFVLIQGSGKRQEPQSVGGSGGVIRIKAPGVNTNHRLQFAKRTDSTQQQQQSSLKKLNALLGPAVEAWSAYNDALESSPLLVKSVTASVILGAADLAGQSLEKIRRRKQQEQSSSQAAGDEGTVLEQKGSIDWPRAIRFAIFGLVLQAPWNHFYYMMLDSQIPPTIEPFTATNGIKVVIDQFLQAPIFTVLIFVFLGVLEGKSSTAIQNQLNNDYKETILANWKLWVPATIVNIGFVPPLYRVLYLNCVFFFWSIYLSLVLNKNEEPEA